MALYGLCRLYLLKVIISTPSNLIFRIALIKVEQDISQCKLPLMKSGV